MGKLVDKKKSEKESSFSPSSLSGEWEEHRKELKATPHSQSGQNHEDQEDVDSMNGTEYTECSNHSVRSTAKTVVRRIIHSAEPRDAHEMVSWFAMSTAWVLIDIVVALGIFLDRYDRRDLNPSLLALQRILEKKTSALKLKKSRLRKRKNSDKVSMTPTTDEAGNSDHNVIRQMRRPRASTYDEQMLNGLRPRSVPMEGNGYKLFGSEGDDGPPRAPREPSRAPTRAPTAMTSRSRVHSLGAESADIKVPPMSPIHLFHDINPMDSNSALPRAQRVLRHQMQSLRKKRKPVHCPSELSDYEQCDCSVFSYLKDQEELWFDFMADCGDGFNPGYEVARLLAQPYLVGTNGLKLQRAHLLLIGGDLAYPGPTPENYQRKLLRLSFVKVCNALNPFEFLSYSL